MQVDHYPNFTFLVFISEKSYETVLIVEINTDLALNNSD